MKARTLVFALFLGLLAQNALAKPPHAPHAPHAAPPPPPHAAHAAPPPPPHIAPPHGPHAAPPHVAPPPPHAPHAVPPHLAGYAPHAPHAPHMLPHIKGINDELLWAASLERQINALQIDSQSKANEHAATQRFRDERRGLELNKKILQAYLLHTQDEAQRQNLLVQLQQTEQALHANRIAEREVRDNAELQRLDAVYRALW